MELKYSVKGTPYIELDDDNKLVFSQSTANGKGYKWLIFSGMSTTSAAVSSGKGKKKTRKKVEKKSPISTVMNMKFTGMSSGVKDANPFLTKSYLEGLKRMFEPYVDDNGIFAYSNISKLKDSINSDNDVNKEDYLNDDPNGYYEEDAE